MKTARIIQFVIAAMLFSAGSAALLTHTLPTRSKFCFLLPALVLIRRSEAVRPVPLRELWIIMAFLVICIVSLILAKLLISESAAERVASHPAFVIPLWLLAMFALFLRWRREQRLANG